MHPGTQLAMEEVQWFSDSAPATSLNSRVPLERTQTELFLKMLPPPEVMHQLRTSATGKRTLVKNKNKLNRWLRFRQQSAVDYFHTSTLQLNLTRALAILDLKYMRTVKVTTRLYDVLKNVYVIEETMAQNIIRGCI